MNKALKAIVAAAVPVVVALMLWISTGTLDEAAFSVGLTGLFTAVLVYFVRNDPPNMSAGQSRRDVAPDTSRKDDLYRK